MGRRSAFSKATKEQIRRANQFPRHYTRMAGRPKLLTPPRPLAHRRRATLTLRVQPPSGAALTFVFGTNPEVVKTAVGAYRADITVNRAGHWSYRWESTGTGEAAEEGWFTVRPSRLEHSCSSMFQVRGEPLADNRRSVPAGPPDLRGAAAWPFRSPRMPPCATSTYPSIRCSRSRFSLI